MFKERLRIQTLGVIRIERSAIRYHRRMSTAQYPHIPASSRLTPLVLRISGGNPGKFTLQGTNTYLLGKGRERILIDAAQGFPIWAETIREVLRKEDAVISTVLLTHHHHDHVLGLKDVPRDHGKVQVWRHPALPSTELYRDMLKQSLDDWGDEVKSLDDGMVFDIPGVSGVTLKVVHTPGHTPDHCAFIVDGEPGTDDKDFFPILFTGDAVLGHGTAVFEDLATYMASLEKMHTATSSLGSPRGTVQAYPAHGEVISDAPGKLKEYMEHRVQREREALEVLRRNRDADGQGDGDSVRGLLPMDMVKIIYKGYPESLHAPAEGGLKLMLKKLQGEGKVEVADGRWRLTEGSEKVVKPGL